MTEWRLSGTVLIACNCDYGCPCNFNAPPSRGYCEGGWTWLIEDGEHGGDRIAGLAVSVFATWPGAIHEGGGRAIAFVDERAQPAQRELLSRVLRGEIGGPWQIFSNTYALEGPHPAAYVIELAEHRSRIRIGDSVRLELEPIRNPVTAAEVHPEIVLPEGLVVKRASLAASREFSVNDALTYTYEGRYTAFGRFDYHGQLT